MSCARNRWRSVRGHGAQEGAAIDQIWDNLSSEQIMLQLITTHLIKLEIMSLAGINERIN